MIAAIYGVLEGRLAGAALIRVGGFTLLVHLPASSLNRLGETGAEVHLHTYLQVREDGLTLYGFVTTQEKDLFMLVTSVSGVGPRTGLALLSNLSPEQLVSAIIRGDADLLGRVPGVGKRLSSRLAVELKDKVARLPVEAAAAPGGDSEVISALSNLGYSLSEASAALAALSLDPSLPVEERLRLTLRHLARR
ncbi:MAG: Holliday junction branch migration protein RuvA [Chloroflexota bacterium]